VADSFVEEGSLAQNVSLLRKALGESDSQKFIETVPRRGYRFVASVRELRDGADLIGREQSESTTAAEAKQEPGISEELAEASQVSEQKALAASSRLSAIFRRKPKRAVLAASLASAVVVAALLYFHILSKPEQIADRARAFQLLERAYKEHCFHLVYLKVWPQFSAVSADPRFQDLVQHIGLSR
jgi:hypothetical protein